jgi:hypothetical protein
VSAEDPVRRILEESNYGLVAMGTLELTGGRGALPPFYPPNPTRSGCYWVDKLIDINQSINMTEEHAKTRRNSRRSAIGRMVPRSFSEPCRWRFDRDRRAGYVRRCGGALTDAQALIVDQMIRAEWLALRTERDAAEAAEPRDRAELLRLAAEHRRQLLLLNRDLEKTIRLPEPARPPSLAGLFAGRGDSEVAGRKDEGLTPEEAYRRLIEGAKLIGLDAKSCDPAPGVAAVRPWRCAL